MIKDFQDFNQYSKARKKEQKLERKIKIMFLQRRHDFTYRKV